MAVLVIVYAMTATSPVALSRAAFCLIRPLGATLGDLLDEALDHGGRTASLPLARW